MQAFTASVQPARRTDHLGWFVGLVVCSGLAFSLALAYILAFQVGHPHLDTTWADNIIMGAWALQAPLAFWGLAGSLGVAWYRRFGRMVIWLLFTAWALLLLVGGSVVVGVLVIGVHSVGEPPPNSPAGREMARVDSLYSSPGFQERLRPD